MIPLSWHSSRYHQMKELSEILYPDFVESGRPNFLLPIPGKSPVPYLVLGYYGGWAMQGEIDHPTIMARLEQDLPLLVYEQRLAALHFIRHVEAAWEPQASLRISVWHGRIKKCEAENDSRPAEVCPTPNPAAAASLRCSISNPLLLLINPQIAKMHETCCSFLFAYLPAGRF